ncbi:23S rRNA (adenine(1618)-N(6))-methyltransferase RlmF [Endozoicomonas sp. OPT23]|uniref:23S rRNA (adenine(1618)-N(6))-methyltransferase RlmF n=1 Tax=Endozoicomonas sp. OPT23 TaxID=2072845 RepID=UPI00129BB55F|nr:23S rRNA (adenine(1618)-N(6))-methyltransferase RlmF [Endozoicomonas sp. OPT23]MRI34428.1 23S rRNA (adenine(1618)-N(6))-methyltransferase RlmF [Endozoicomonas sp. OPT23]
MTRKTALLHPDNPHQGSYDLLSLASKHPALKPHLIKNPTGQLTIDFRSPESVKELNRALLRSFYQIEHWDIPEGYLCPPVPGRTDYLHHAADLLKPLNPKKVQALDIGTGANLIYPIIGSQTFGWSFIASDIDPVSVNTAKTIVDANSVLKGKIKAVLQPDQQSYFRNIVAEADRVHITVCNPPFHSSLEEAQSGTERKWRNLDRSRQKRNGIKVNDANKNPDQKLNFGGQKAELWCKGGELLFLKKMIRESQDFSQQICWFTSLVSKKDNLLPLQKLLTRMKAKQVKVIAMSQGQKISHMLAWSFMDNGAQSIWVSEHQC